MLFVIFKHFFFKIFFIAPIGIFTVQGKQIKSCIPCTAFWWYYHLGFWGQLLDREEVQLNERWWQYLERAWQDVWQKCSVFWAWTFTVMFKCNGLIGLLSLHSLESEPISLYCGWNKADNWLIHKAWDWDRIVRDFLLPWIETIPCR